MVERPQRGIRARGTSRASRDRVASPIEGRETRREATVEDRIVVLALVLSTALALIRVIRGGLKLDALDGDFSLALLFFLVGAWILAAEARERGSRFLRRRHR